MKKLLTSIAAVILATGLTLGTSFRADAATWDSINNYANSCINDPGNSTTNDTVVVIWHGCDNQVGGSWLAGEHFTSIAIGQYGLFELKLENGMCLDNRGSTTNGSTYVVKSCNGSSSQEFFWCSDATGNPEYEQPNFDLLWLPRPTNYQDGDAIVVYYNSFVNGFPASATSRQEAMWYFAGAGPAYDYAPATPASSYPSC